MLDAICTICGSALERMRYFPRELITADDMRAEQEYFINKMRRHNRFLHGWGVVCGCNVIPLPEEGHPWQVQVCPGYVVAPQGDDVLIGDCITFDLQKGRPSCDPCSVTYPCPPQPVFDARNEWTLAYLAIRYVECLTRPVRVHPAGCGCDEMDCEYSRVRESFELKLLWSLPESHLEARKWDQAWLKQAKQHMPRPPVRGRGAAYPVPDCLPCTDDPWVVLATIRIPKVPDTGPNAGNQPPITAADIKFDDRRVLYSVSALQILVTAGP